MSEAAERPPSPGLCEQCAHARRVPSSKGSVFWRCLHPDLPKYPQLPVLDCDGFVPAEDAPVG